MQETKLNGFSKILAFLLVAVFIISIVIFSAQGNELTPNQPESGKVGTLSDKADENKDGNNQNLSNKQEENNGTDTPDTDDEATNEKPLFLNKLTGLPTSDVAQNSTVFGVLIDPLAQAYGLSYADIAIELPTESGTSKMLVYSSAEETVWKIGTLVPSRKYISTLSKYFGGIVVGYGSDDKVQYTPTTTQNELDLSKHQDCFYIENETNIYTNENLINTAHNRTQLSATTSPYKEAPFSFSDTVMNSGIDGANNVTIPFSASNITSFTYNALTGKYEMLKNGISKQDMLNGQSIDYTNLFILFANSTTYENSSASQLVIDTASGGKGYYFTKGRLTEFIWCVNSDGELEFRNLMGERLSVNKGTSYIAYYKASRSYEIQK